MPPSKGGITLENHIYIDPSSHPKRDFSPETVDEDFDTLAEEVAHTGQYGLGMTRLGYLWEGLKKGYWDNPYEVEAQRIAYPNYDQLRDQRLEEEQNERANRPVTPPREEWQNR